MKQETINQPHPRIVRYHELRPCFDAFIDTRSPGSDKKENFTIIGPGVSENPNQYVHITEAHGFNIGGARQPPECLNSQHSHDTAEVFFVHRGTWTFDMGEHGDDASITLRAGDIISIPTKVFRGFKNIGTDDGYLWAVLGQDNPGRVLWAPDVFDMAKKYGLVLLENGSLVDTAKGQTVDDGIRPMPVTSRKQVDSMKVFSNEDLEKCCILASDDINVSDGEGTTSRKLIGKEAKLAWPHGFTVEHVSLATGTSNTPQKHENPDVIFVHSGALTVKVDNEVWELNPGDTATIPRGVLRQFSNQGHQAVEFVRVQGEV